MSKGKPPRNFGGPRPNIFQAPLPGVTVLPPARNIKSFFDVMQDGNEYNSIVGLIPANGTDVAQEVKKGIAEIEAIRGRPCLMYIGNTIRPVESSIDNTDDLPFTEMVASVPEGARDVDVLLVTGGGSGQQVVRFVERLRARFDRVSFLLPSLCMSAGTLFALSGDEIWMDERACLGPIDPQVPTRDGRYVPAQALLVLVNELQRQGQREMEQGRGVPWSLVRVIDTLDKKELGDAVTASAYAQTMASEFLEKYKFRNWTTRQTAGAAVSPEYRKQRAQEVGAQLVSHERWKSHGHSITREVLWNEIKLKIEHPAADLQRAMRRTWAVCHWIFDKTPVQKLLLASNYSYVKHTTMTVERTI